MVENSKKLLKRSRKIPHLHGTRKRRTSAPLDFKLWIITRDVRCIRHNYGGGAGCWGLEGEHSHLLQTRSVITPLLFPSSFVRVCVWHFCVRHHLSRSLINQKGQVETKKKGNFSDFRKMQWLGEVVTAPCGGSSLAPAPTHGRCCIFRLSSAVFAAAATFSLFFFFFCSSKSRRNSLEFVNRSPFFRRGQKLAKLALA